MSEQTNKRRTRQTEHVTFIKLNEFYEPNDTYVRFGIIVYQSIFCNTTFIPKGIEIKNKIRRIKASMKFIENSANYSELDSRHSILQNKV